MTHILNEEASQPLLEAVLRNLVKQQKVLVEILYGFMQLSMKNW